MRPDGSTRMVVLSSQDRQVTVPYGRTVAVQIGQDRYLVLGPEDQPGVHKIVSSEKLSGMEIDEVVSLPTEEEEEGE